MALVEGRADTHPAFDVLVVASWFPSVDDAGAGRFVADQAEALAATGQARVSVVTFDPAGLTGGAAARGIQAAAVTRAAVAAAKAAEPLFIAPAWAIERQVPVARLTVPDGLTAAAGPAHGPAHRAPVLDVLARRMAARSHGVGRGVVHAHTVYPDGAAAADLAARLGWPLIVTEHSSFVGKIASIPAQRAAYSRTLERAHRTFAVSQMLAGELRAAFPDQANRIDVLPNSVPLDRFSVGDAADRVPDELLFVGYRKVTKGIDVLLRAVAEARIRRPSIRLRLVGRSPDEETEARWVALAEDLGVRDAVTFEASVDRAGIAAAMRRASLFVHPSPRETFGVVAVEALASGLPVVATDSGGVTEILGPVPAALGAIVAADDPVALGSAIVATLERAGSFEPSALRAAVERRFRSDFIAERLLVTYREALAKAPGREAEPLHSGRGTGAADGGGLQGPARDESVRTVVVGLDRARAAARLAALPDELRGRLVVLTATEPASIHLPPVGRLVEVAVVVMAAGGAAPAATHRQGAGRSGPAGRLARLARDPLGTITRRLGRGPGSEGSLLPATDTLREIIRSIATEDLRVLAVDGHDAVAAAPIVDGGLASWSSGGLRRLADAWLAAGGRAGFSDS